MGQKSMTLSVFVVAALAFQCHAGVLRGQPSAVKAEDVETSFISELIGLVAKDRPADFEAGLRQTYTSLPKNMKGNLGHQAVRYVLHRHFVQKHGWFIKGLEPTGKVESSASFMKDWVPSYLQDLLEKRVQEHGVNLQELSVLAATLEVLIQKEASSRLEEVYGVMRLPMDAKLNRQQVDTMTGIYMMNYLSADSVAASSPAEAELNLKEFVENYDDWSTTETWLNKIKASHLQGLGNSGQGLDFASTQRIANDIGERFAQVNDLECKSLKSTLLKMEGRREGRVPLADFYKKSLYSHWNFSEKVEYLRVLGALDESDPKHPHVIVSNYLSSRPNCLEATNLYAVCCRNECEDLMGHLEAKIVSSSASPDKIIGLVSTMSSDTVKGPRTLSQTLTQRLQEVATTNGGKVPLHGRLFAQWMHHAFPRECPYPHESGSVSPQTPDEWMKENGQEDHKASESEMQAHVDACTAAGEGEDDLPWSSQEELLVHGHDSEASHVPASISLQRLFLGVGLVVVAAFFAGIAWFATAAEGKLLGPGCLALALGKAMGRQEDLAFVFGALSVALLVGAAVITDAIDSTLLGFGLFTGCGLLALQRLGQRPQPAKSCCFE